MFCIVAHTRFYNIGSKLKYNMLFCTYQIEVDENTQCGKGWEKWKLSITQKHRTVIKCLIKKFLPKKLKVGSNKSFIFCFLFQHNEASMMIKCQA